MTEKPASTRARSTAFVLAEKKPGPKTRNDSIKSLRTANGGSQPPKKQKITSGAPPSVPPPSAQEHVPARTSDPLQIAAQAYSWTYMISTLQACFQTAESSAHTDLVNRSKSLDEEETEISDQRTRFEAEHAIAFYEELATSTFAQEGPTIMKAFLQHGDACVQVNAGALRLATQVLNQMDDCSPVEQYNDTLAKLEDLRDTATRLESSIVRLLQFDRTEPRSSSHAEIISVFAACLPVVRARAANLVSAHELVRRSKVNVEADLHLESLRLSIPS